MRLRSRLALIALVVGLLAAALGGTASAAAVRHVEGRVLLSVDRSPSTFKLRDSERGTDGQSAGVPDTKASRQDGHPANDGYPQSRLDRNSRRARGHGRSLWPKQPQCPGGSQSQGRYPCYGSQPGWNGLYQP